MNFNDHFITNHEYLLDFVAISITCVTGNKHIRQIKPDPWHPLRREKRANIQYGANC